MCVQDIYFTNLEQIKNQKKGFIPKRKLIVVSTLYVNNLITTDDKQFEDSKMSGLKKTQNRRDTFFEL